MPTRHAPITQVIAAAWGSAHALPHAPQWARLSLRLVSQPLETVASQSPKPVSQRPGAHTPIAQEPVVWADPHARPHRPQCIGSESVCTQSLEQTVSPGAHDSTQDPPTHACPSAHACPQAPQCDALLVLSTQKPSHARSEPGHCAHTPLEHTRPGLQDDGAEPLEQHGAFIAPQLADPSTGASGRVASRASSAASLVLTVASVTAASWSMSNEVVHAPRSASASAEAKRRFTWWVPFKV